ncbi:MAG TPA: GNAT family N-acetyltransferase [Saprospiraceae bacterium]|nr:GNAT family N-acetyltransferase [Saprospiraceae bacterium]
MNYSIFITQEVFSLDTDMDNIGPGADPLLLRIEIQALMQDNIILRTSPYVLIACNLDGKPALRQELGRQREMTFRQIGESTGLAYDTDSFDDYYEQLIIWDEIAERLVGGYRFGCGDRIFAEYGPKGFYINSFFNIDPAFNKFLPQCVELGRSFIVEDYQRKNLPLYLLWKGIMAYMIKNKQFKFLIGPVSISRYYSDYSRKVLMEYAKRNFYHPDFAKWFSPKTPFNPGNAQNGTIETCSDQDKVFDIEDVLDQLQPDHIQFPVLMKQYIRQNAKFLGFNLDPNFNNALDGLMIMDIADIPDNTIQMLQRE